MERQSKPLQIVIFGDPNPRYATDILSDMVPPGVATKSPVIIYTCALKIRWPWARALSNEMHCIHLDLRSIVIKSFRTSEDTCWDVNLCNIHFKCETKS